MTVDRGRRSWALGQKGSDVNPWQWWDAERIATVTGCPLANVREHWPIIAAALERRGLWERDNARAVIATVSIETASTFLPVEEAYWLPLSYRQGLQYAPFWGRGYAQLTWESNYRAAGSALGIDLLSHPERALEPSVAADVLAWFWATKGVPSKHSARWWSLSDLSHAHDWEWVRRVFQGGTDGLDRLVRIVKALGGDAVSLTYNPDARVDAQPDDWSCSIQSAEWLLRSLGRNPGDQWIQDQLLNAGIVTRADGLTDASGRRLADWLNREYGTESGWVAQASPVTFDDVLAGAGLNPMIVGGRKWNHWSGVRGKDGGALILANPADGWKGVGQTMSRAQWDALGPFTCVWVDMSAVGTAPVPQPSRASVLVAEIEARLAELKHLVA